MEDELDRLTKDAFAAGEVYEAHRARNIYGLSYEDAQKAYSDMERARLVRARAIRAVNEYIDQHS